MRSLSNRALRTAVGISRRRLAVLAGVSSPTMGVFEANPTFVGDEVRARCERTYDALREAVGKMPGGPKLLKGE